MLGFFISGAMTQFIVDRIRGRRGVEIRQSFLRANPLCVHCAGKGIVRAATQVDHIIPLHQGGTETSDNRQGLCNECHEVKTLRETGRTPKPTIGEDGWPVGRG